MVSDTESDEGSNESLTDEKMLTGLIHEVIAEHKQEQADWNNLMKRLGRFARNSGSLPLITGQGKSSLGLDSNLYQPFQ